MTITKLSGAAVATLALACAATAEAQPRPTLRLPTTTPPAVQVVPQAGPPHANTVDAENRPTAMLQARVDQLEAQMTQLQAQAAQSAALLAQATAALQAEQAARQALAAALQAEQAARGALQTRFDTHWHRFAYAGLGHHQQQVVTASHLSGDETASVGVVDQPVEQFGNTRQPETGPYPGGPAFPPL